MRTEGAGQDMFSTNLAPGLMREQVRATTYTAKVTDTAQGTIRSVAHAIQYLEDVVEALTRNLADSRKRLAETEAQIGASFEYTERLAELARRQQEIEDDLDLTKSQAPSQLEADPSDQSAAATPI